MPAMHLATLTLVAALLLVASALPLPPHCLRLNLTVPAPNATAADSTVAIRSQLLVAAIFGGGTVALEDGVYKVSSGLVLPPRVCLRGHGTTLLRATAPLNAVVASYAHNAVIYQLGIDGANAARHGLLLRNMHNVTAFNLSIRHTTDDALRLQNVSHAALKHVELRNAARDGLAVSGGTNLTLAHCSVQRAARHALQVGAAAKRVSVRHLRIYAAQHGVVVKPFAVDGPAPEHVHVSHANISTTSVAAVWVKRAAHVRLVSLHAATTPTCYRLTEAIVALVGGSCHAPRRLRGEAFALPACAPGEYSMRSACCPAACGNCIADSDKCEAGKDECCAPKVLEDNGRKCGKVEPPCML